MKLYKAIRFLMLSGILTLVLSRCIRESLEGCPLDTLLRFTYKPRGSAADLFDCIRSTSKLSEPI